MQPEHSIDAAQSERAYGSPDGFRYSPPLACPTLAFDLQRRIPLDCIEMNSIANHHTRYM